MVITEVKTKKNGTEYEIYIDGTQKLVVDTNLVIKFGIEKGLNIDEEWVSKLCAQANYKSAYDYSLKLLSIKDRVSNEIVNKLKQKKYNQETINMVLAKLTDLGYINDEKYVEIWLKERSILPGMSKKALYYKLLQKGINKCLLNDKFSEIEIDESSTAFLAAQKKLNEIKGDKKAVKNKLYMYLKRKGYNDEICYNTIRKVLKDNIW